MINRLTIYDDAAKLVREMPFHAGLNIIVAEKGKNKDGKKTRNGVGKTTFLRIIRFCLGSELDSAKRANSKRQIKFREKLCGWRFCLDADVGRYHLEVTRYVGADEKHDVVEIHVVSGPVEELPPCTPHLQERTFEMAIPTWRKFLASELFGMDLFALPQGEKTEYYPSSEDLIGYFVRRCFVDAMIPGRGMKMPKARMSVSYLLGLKWGYMVDFAKINEKDVKPKRAIAVFNDYLEEQKINERLLASKVVDLERQIEAMKKQLAAVEVEEARKIAADTAIVNCERLQELYRQISCDEYRLRDVRRALDLPWNPIDVVERVYGDAQRVFKPDALRDIGAVQNFHHEVFVERKKVLRQEHDALCDRLHQLTDEKNALEAEEKKGAEILNAQGILAKYAALANQVADLEKDLVVKQSKLEEYRTAQEAKRTNAEERTGKLAEMKEDFLRDAGMISAAEDLFKALMDGLYEGANGSLNVDLTKKNAKMPGYVFEPFASKADSEGIEKMVMFALDLTLLRRGRQLRRAMDFIVHDSILFDHTDERQIGLALAQVVESSRSDGFQYICTINSDTLNKPGCLEKLPNLKDYICPDPLNDTEHGSLLRKWF